MVLVLRIGGAARAARRERTHQTQNPTAGPVFFWACALAAWIWLGPVSVGSIPVAQARAGSPSDAAPSRSNPTKADTTSTARHSAVGAIPFEKLEPEARRKAASVLSATTLFRRMPAHVIPCDPDLYRFLVRHPDVVVGIWEELGISELRMAQSGPGTFRAVEGKSTVATAEFLYQDEDTHIVYCEGEYHGPFLGRPIRGRTLLILKTGYVRQGDGRHYIISRLDTFTHIDNATVEFLTRTFQPLVGKIADHNFLQTSAFVGSLSRTVELNHRGAQRLAARLHRVRPEVRKEFAALARQVAQKSTRQASHEVPVGARVAAGPTR